MQIAICDNECIAADALFKIMKKVSKESHVQKFTSIQQFWEVVENGWNFHVVFMDIDWNQPSNGMDFAAELYERSPDTQIIYVTGYNERFSQQIFLKPANLCGYLVKPVDERLLHSMLQKAKDTLAHQTDRKLLVQQKGIVHAIPFRDIVFLESIGHQVFIHTHSNIISCYERLDTFGQRLPIGFLKCHKSYIVNMDCIQRIEKKSILMSRGECVPISKVQYTNARSTFFRYIGEIL